MKTEDRSQWRTTTRNARLKIFDVGSTTNCLSLCSLRSNIYMYNNRNTPRYLVMLEMPLSTTPTMTKSVSKTIKTISRKVRMEVGEVGEVLWVICERKNYDRKELSGF